jgi:hypothetical protein
MTKDVTDFERTRSLACAPRQRRERSHHDGLGQCSELTGCKRESQGSMRVEKECARHLGRPAWRNEGTEARQCSDTLSNELSQAFLYHDSCPYEEDGKAIERFFGEWMSRSPPFSTLWERLLYPCVALATSLQQLQGYASNPHSAVRI